MTARQGSGGSVSARWSRGAAAANQTGKENIETHLDINGKKSFSCKILVAFVPFHLPHINIFIRSKTLQRQTKRISSPMVPSNKFYIE